MGDLSKNFSRSEFVCKGENCCEHSAPIRTDLIECLQQLRDLIGSPLVVESGFRCIRHNREIEGSVGSQHTLGLAADVLVPPLWTANKLADLAAKVDYFRDGGIGIYPGRVHLDVRTGGAARWEEV